MKFTIPCSILKNELQVLSGVLPSKTTLPIIGNILFEAKNGKLFLTATDLEVSLQSSLDCEVEKEGAVAIPGKILSDIVRELPDYPIQFSSDEEFRVVITTPSGELNIFGADDKEFPQIPKIKKKSELTLNSAKIKRMTEKVLLAVSKDELKGVLTGVLFQFKESDLRMVATDGHRLARIMDKSFSSEDDLIDIIIPPKALGLFLKNAEEEEFVFTIGDNYVIFDLGAKTIYSSLLQGEFPDYERVIPVNNEKQLVVDREKLIQSLRLVQVFANRMTLQVKMSLTKDQAEISSEDADRGAGNDTIPADYDNEDIVIGFNAGYLLDSLRIIDTENVVIEMDKPDSGCIILPQEQQEEEDIFILVMPIKLKDA